jgi:carboxylate-amine ligase
MLRATLVDAAPAAAGGTTPHIAVLSDGPSNSAWWEHGALADAMGVALVTGGGRGGARRAPVAAEDRSRPIDVVYRRTDDTSPRPGAAELLREPLEAGGVGIVNGFGTGVADDKLSNAYVEDLIRFYLGEEPVLPSVRSFDLLREDHRAEALERPSRARRQAAQRRGRGRRWSSARTRTRP